MTEEIILTQTKPSLLTAEKKKPDIRELTLANGIRFPSDRELLMLILGSGTRGVPVSELAQNALAVIECSDGRDLVQNLTQVEGLGINRSLSIAAALEFGRRHYLYKQATINSTSEVIPYVKHYALHKKEHFVCVTLSGAREILDIRVISIGTTSKTLVHPREVFAEAVQQHASAIICCHNHPGGNCYPSNADRETTRRLRVASDYLGIAFLDHIILTTTEYFSFREHSLLEDEEEAEHQ